jgi:GNAT superfamily N-acetyltransferase
MTDVLGAVPGTVPGNTAAGATRSALLGGVRLAAPGDVPVILELVRDLAIYEREPDAVEMSADQLAAALFGPAPSACCHVATDPATDPAADGGAAAGPGIGAVVGFALWFTTFSTWTGRPGLYLEDLFVRPDARGRGHGLALMRALAATCVERGYGRFEWSVLTWNTPSIGFYRSIGAVATDEWMRYRLDGPALDALAAATPPASGQRA